LTDLKGTHIGSLLAGVHRFVEADNGGTKRNVIPGEVKIEYHARFQ
jgi:metal-dependent amidase/aminoacylase/carboxypeptidase family protein